MHTIFLQHITDPTELLGRPLWTKVNPHMLFVETWYTFIEIIWQCKNVLGRAWQKILITFFLRFLAHRIFDIEPNWTLSQYRFVNQFRLLGHIFIWSNLETLTGEFIYNRTDKFPHFLPTGSICSWCLYHYNGFAYDSNVINYE